MRRVVKYAGLVLGIGVIAAGCGVGWLKWAATERLDETFKTHRVDIPMPFPLSQDEIDALRQQRLAAMPAPEPGQPAPDPLAGVDLKKIALDNARARGKHLVEARYVCVMCHGADFGGGFMIKDPMIGTLRCPNITTGKGSRTLNYTMADWDRIVRHGVKPDGTPAVMPSDAFVEMTDHELSDIVAYIRSLPPVDGETPRPEWGPLGLFLVATGKFPLEAEMLPDHFAKHAVEPPPTAVSIPFGKHLAAVCKGCHREHMNGGPIVGAPPDWPPAANLTPSKDGLAGWTFADFQKTLRTNMRPDGKPLRFPMVEVAPLASNMTDTEMRALWMYLQSLRPMPDGT